MVKDDVGLFALIGKIIIGISGAVLIVAITIADSKDDKDRENKRLYGKFCKKVCESTNYEIEEDMCICLNGKEYKIEK